MINGTSGDDTLVGGAGDDTLDGGDGGAGDDVIDGGGDFDIALFSGSVRDYGIVIAGGVVTVTDLNAADGDTAFSCRHRANSIA